jgi:hypothetical protein
MSNWVDAPPAIINRGRPKGSLRNELQANQGKWKRVQINQGRNLVREGYERVQRRGDDGVIRVYMRWPSESAPVVIEASASVIGEINDL